MSDGKLTTKAKRAVRLLVENPGITAQRFGKLMWPDSPHHERWQGSVEQGMAKGRVMFLVAGSYLHHLKRKGLVEMVPERPGRATIWRATGAGEEASLAIGSAGTAAPGREERQHG